MSKSKFYISEVFHSMQGEGSLTGQIGPWVRFFSCNLACQGFGQKDPKDPSTYKQPHLDLDVSSYEKMEDLPVFEFGCDSSYSVNKKFRPLAQHVTASDVCDLIVESMKNKHNPEGKFRHPSTKEEQHLHFTGGEPLLKKHQQAIVDILKEFERRENFPRFITFETNGTQQLTEVFTSYIQYLRYTLDVEVLFSISPKLFTVSGELNSKAIRPYEVALYGYAGEVQLKFVVNGSDECWTELEEVIKLFKEAGVYSPVYVMPVGGLKEQQESKETADIVDEAIARGYRISGRLHCHIWGNSIGK